MMINKLMNKVRRLKGHLKKIRKYGGRSRKCPICGNGSRHFSEHGIVSRPDARCPFCDALERHRLFWLFLEKKTLFFSRPPRKALHIAPEAVLESKFRPLVGEGYLTADLFDPRVDVKMDITDIQYPDRTFDFIYCSHVLEHVPDDRKAMREFRRVLSPNGMACLLVPISAEVTVEDPSIEDPKERLRLFGQEDHFRRYGPDYLSRLVEAGFNVEVLKAEDFLSPVEIEMMGITQAAGVLHICTLQDDSAGLKKEGITS